MIEQSIKPTYLTFTERWVTKVVIAWCCMALVIGVSNIELMAGVTFPLMTVVLFFVCRWLIKFVLNFQKVNPFMPQRYFGHVVKFFWLVGIYFCCSLIFRGLFGNIEAEHGAFFLMVGAVFPLGISLGAAQAW